MKIVVTGGLGFIGSHLVGRLMREGHHTVVIDNFSSRRTQDLRSLMEHRELEVVNVDVRSRNVVHRILEGADVVIHLAALVGLSQSLRDPQTTTDVNVRGTLNVLESCTRSKVGRLIMASSSAVYESSTQPLNENSNLRATSPYAASKIASEAYCNAFSYLYGLDVVILRLFNVYGPGNTVRTGTVMARFAQALQHESPLIIFGDGRQTRDFVHVQDVVDAIKLAITRQGASAGIFNIGSGKATTINSLANMFIMTSGFSNAKVEYQAARIAEIRHNYADISKAKSLLRYSPKVALNDGVREYLSWSSGQVDGPSPKMMI